MKWRNRPSVLDITAVRENRERFTFSSVTVADATKEINIINSSKTIQEVDLPGKLLKDNKDFFAAYIAKYFNDSLKCARPISALPVISKIFGRIICNQLSKKFFKLSMWFP